MSFFVRVLLAIDRFLNVILLGRWDETLSARAHRMRMKDQPYFFWLADAIDWLFWWQPHHCRLQWEYENRNTQGIP